MQLEHQVCTLAQAKKLKELGVSQQALFSWCGDENHKPKGKPWVWVSQTVPVNNQQEEMRNDVPSSKPFAAAFTVAELGLMCTWPDKDYRLAPYSICYDGHAQKWRLSMNPHSINPESLFFDHEAHMRADLLIRFITTGIRDVEYVNKRLLS